MMNASLCVMDDPCCACRDLTALSCFPRYPANIDSAPRLPRGRFLRLRVAAPTQPRSMESVRRVTEGWAEATRIFRRCSSGASWLQQLGFRALFYDQYCMCVGGHNLPTAQARTFRSETGAGEHPTPEALEWTRTAKKGSQKSCRIHLNSFQCLLNRCTATASSVLWGRVSPPKESSVLVVGVSMVCVAGE